MTARFEDRHREVQDAVVLGAAHPSPIVRGRALLARDRFYQRASALVDALVAAVRELRDAPRDGTVGIAALHRRMEAALAALDDEAGQ